MEEPSEFWEYHRIRHVFGERLFDTECSKKEHQQSIWEDRLRERRSFYMDVDDDCVIDDLSIPRQWVFRIIQELKKSDESLEVVSKIIRLLGLK